MNVNGFCLSGRPNYALSNRNTLAIHHFDFKPYTDILNKIHMSKCMSKDRCQRYALTVNCNVDFSH